MRIASVLLGILSCEEYWRGAASFVSPAQHCQLWSTTGKDKLHYGDKDDEHPPLPASWPEQSNRRRILNKIAATIVSAGSPVIGSPSCAQAGDVEAKITRAVTQSDLGIAVRRATVGGAQTIDKLDGQWEQFSDRFQLGSERSRRDGRPAPKKIPPLQPLDAQAASRLLRESDRAFLAASKGVSAQDLNQKIEVVDSRVSKSFSTSLEQPTDTAQQFNYVSYVHYKAYVDLIGERMIDFATFRPVFDRLLGAAVLTVLSDDLSLVTNKETDRQAAWLLLQSQIVSLGSSLVERGLVAQVDLGAVDEDQLSDWVEDMVDLEWSVEVDGDSTLGAQVLLQEQGFRLYPSYTRCAIETILERTIAPSGLEAKVDEYYMDTDYNSDPNKFEVKQLFVNIVIGTK